MNEDITEFFSQLISQAGSYDIAVADFKKFLAEDVNLKEEYRQWCENMGYSERDGFASFCEEHMNNDDSIWDSLNDYDE